MAPSVYPFWLSGRRMSAAIGRILRMSWCQDNRGRIRRRVSLALPVS
jgi:hypothetical protein